MMARRALRPLVVYLLTAVVMTWPLALHPASVLGAPVGAGDPYLNLWILGWGMQTALADPAAILSGRVFDANIFYPASGTLAYSDHLLFQSVLLSPVYALTGDVTLCYNLLLLASLTLSALAMHLFIRRVVGSEAGAYVAGLAWGFGSYRFAHLIHLQLQSLYWLPLAFLFLHRLVAGRRRVDAVILGVIAALQAVTSVYYAIIGGIAIVVGALVLTFMSSRRGWSRMARRLALGAVVAALLTLPVALVYWRVQQDEGFGRNLYEASRNSAFVDSYLQVPPGNVLYGRSNVLRRDPDPSTEVPHTGPERELFPGLALLALALAGVVLGWRSDARPLVASMVAVGLTGFVLSLGPDGARDLYATLHRYVFGFQAIRAPARFAVLVSFGLAVLAALGWRELSTRAHRVGRAFQPVVLLAFGVLVLETAHLPTALADAPPMTTEVGAWLRQAPGTGPVAVLPLGLDIESTPAMVQSLEHRRPLLNGYSGQRPSFYAPLVDTLSTFPSDESLLALHEIGVQYVVSPTAVPRPSNEPSWPLVPRAQFSSGTIYEMQWSDAAEARYSHLSSVEPPPPGPIPFPLGEEAAYAVTWDGAGLNVAAGEVTVRVEPPAYRFVVRATTAPWVARFFEADDLFVTTAGGDLIPRLHERELNEGSRHVTRAYVYDFGRGVVRSGPNVREAQLPDAITSPLVPLARDAIAALFYARTLRLEPEQTVQLPVNEAGRNLVISLTARGIERITVGGRDVEALRLEPRIDQRVERRASVAATMWLSVDARRVPLAVDVSAGFGRVRLELTRYRGAT